MITTQSHTTLSRMVVITGFVAFVLSITAGIQFYTTLGHDTFGKLTYVIAGVLLTSLTVLTLSLSAYLYSRGNVIAATLLAIGYMVLLSLEIFAEFGFLATQQETRAVKVAQDSMPAQIAKESITSAESEIDFWSKYANTDIAQLQSQQAEIQSRISSLESQLQACPKGYLSKCINPTRDKLVSARQELIPIEQAINGYENYQSALTNKERAMSELANVSTGQNVQLAISPAYTWAARLFSVDPKILQASTSLLISTLLALWASFAGFILLTMTKHHEEILEKSIEGERVPAGFLPEGFKAPAPAIAKKEANNNKPIAQVNDVSEANDIKPMAKVNDIANDTPTKKAVGTVYQCVDCGSEYTARTVWQKRCPACTAKVKANVLSSKRRKVVA